MIFTKVFPINGTLKVLERMWNREIERERESHKENERIIWNHLTNQNENYLETIS